MFLHIRLSNRAVLSGTGLCSRLPDRLSYDEVVWLQIIDYRYDVCCLKHQIFGTISIKYNASLATVLQTMLNAELETSANMTNISSDLYYPSIHSSIHPSIHHPSILKWDKNGVNCESDSFQKNGTKSVFSIEKKVFSITISMITLRLKQSSLLMGDSGKH